MSTTTNNPTAPPAECFVIMPISDQDSYAKGHFQRVYTDIISPACTFAGYKAIRADDVKASNFIHLDILQKLLVCPMAVCDLSSSNPNVLFELALRQAFDKPVALIQEVGTKQIFDIAPLRYTEYRKERVYHEVIEDQARICKAIGDTAEAFRTGKGINSIVKLLSLSQPAKLPDASQESQQADLQRILLAEMGQLRAEFRSAVKTLQGIQPRDEKPSHFPSAQRVMIESNLGQLESLKDMIELGLEDQLPEFESILARTRRLLMESMNTEWSSNEGDFLYDAEYRLERYHSFLASRTVRKTKGTKVEKTKL